MLFLCKFCVFDINVRFCRTSLVAFSIDSFILCKLPLIERQDCFVNHAAECAKTVTELMVENDVWNRKSIVTSDK